MGVAASYRTETHQATIGTQSYTVIERIPEFSSDEQRKQVAQQIEYGLYRVFENHSQDETKEAATPP